MGFPLIGYVWERCGVRLLMSLSAATLLLFASAACGNASTLGPNPTSTAGSPTGQGSLTPTLDDGVRVTGGTLELQSGATGDMEIIATDLPEPGLAGFTIDVFYDATVIKVNSVSPGDQAWGGLTSNIVETGEARLVAGRAEGVTGETVLAVLEVEAVGVPGESTDVQLVLQDFVDSGLNEIDAVACCGAVTIR